MAKILSRKTSRRQPQRFQSNSSPASIEIDETHWDEDKSKSILIARPSRCPIGFELSTAREAGNPLFSFHLELSGQRRLFKRRVSLNDGALSRGHTPSGYRGCEPHPRKSGCRYLSLLWLEEEWKGRARVKAGSKVELLWQGQSCFLPPIVHLLPSVSFSVVPFITTPLSIHHFKLLNPSRTR